MRWFFSTRTATGFARRILDSQHHNGGTGPGRVSHFLRTQKFTTSIGTPCQSSAYAAAMFQPSSLLLHRHYHPTTTLLNYAHSLDRVDGKDEKDTKKVDLEIISTESIKPASPTPHHLRTYNLSILDQFFFDCHTPTVIFLPNTDNLSVSDVITKRSKHLKDSLSQLLTGYYPFAGEIKNSMQIDCNDKGVYFVEARVNQTLHDFLRQPDDLKVRELTPQHPSATETSSGNHVISVQVNIFECGGIALGSTVTHKIIDGHSYFRFMNAWAAAARGSPEKFPPSFVASEIFPNNPSLEYSLPSKLSTSNKIPTTKRFFFDSTALASLKDTPVASERGPTRVEATGALIWKAAAKAASSVRPFSPQSPHALLPFVNFRKKASPALPTESIGNLMIATVAICFPANKLELPTLMGDMRESIAKINTEFVEALKGEKGHETVNMLLKMLNDLFDAIDEGDGLLVTSLLNSGIYDIDFGWGKPIWFYHMNPGCPRLFALNDTVNGRGVEAAVSMSAEEMEFFERDPEILAYTTVDPSPLQYLN